MEGYTGAGVRKRKRGGGSEREEKKEVAVAVAAAVVAERVQEEEAEDYTGITEESIAEVMSWLELEIKLAAPPAASPPAAYVAAKGGSTESCGPSISGSASTVMASVDVRAGAPAPPAVPWPRPAVAPEEEAADDEWVAQLLTDGPAVEGQCSS